MSITKNVRKIMKDQQVERSNIDEMLDHQELFLEMRKKGMARKNEYNLAPITGTGRKRVPITILVR